MWKRGGPDTAEMATPKGVRTSRPKYSDAIRFLRISMDNIKKNFICEQKSMDLLSNLNTGCFALLGSIAMNLQMISPNHFFDVSSRLVAIFLVIALFSASVE